MNCGDEVAVAAAIGFLSFPIAIMGGLLWMFFVEPAIRHQWRRLCLRLRHR